MQQAEQNAVYKLGLAERALSLLKNWQFSDGLLVLVLVLLLLLVVFVVVVVVVFVVVVVVVVVFFFFFFSFPLFRFFLSISLALSGSAEVLQADLEAAKSEAEEMRCQAANAEEAYRIVTFEPCLTSFFFLKSVVAFAKKFWHAKKGIKQQ